MNQILTIGSIDVRQDDQGRYCLNDLHRAAGGLQQHRPNYWVSNKQTQALVAEISSAGIPALAVVNGGNKQGTYVCRELIYAYAMWISAAFQLKVIRAYDALVTGQEQPTPQPQIGNARGINEALVNSLVTVVNRLLDTLNAPQKPKRPTVRPITEEEIRMARAMKSQGVSLSAIARQLGRSTASISMLTRELH
jgi:hypothetical protein